MPNLKFNEKKFILLQKVNKSKQKFFKKQKFSYKTKHHVNFKKTSFSLDISVLFQPPLILLFYSWKLKNKIKIKHFKLWSNIYQKWCSWNVCLFWFFFVGNLFLKFTNYKKMSWNHVNNDCQLQFFTFNIFTFKKISVTLMKFYRALTMVFTKTTQMHTFFNRFFFASSLL